jgi:peptide/nickel transport system substrate-binding protein
MTTTRRTFLASSATMLRATPAQRAVFERNPEGTGPEPDSDRVVLPVITEVRAAELAFEAGEVDCTELGPDALARQKEMPEDVAVFTAGQLQYMWLGMNTEPPKLQDIRVRQAIQHAVDVDVSDQVGIWNGDAGPARSSTVSTRTV